MTWCFWKCKTEQPIGHENNWVESLPLSAFDWEESFKTQVSITASHTFRTWHPGGTYCVNLPAGECVHLSNHIFPFFCLVLLAAEWEPEFNILALTYHKLRGFRFLKGGWLAPLILNIPEDKNNSILPQLLAILSSWSYSKKGLGAHSGLTIMLESIGNTSMALLCFQNTLLNIT